MPFRTRIAGVFCGVLLVAPFAMAGARRVPVKHQVPAQTPAVPPVQQPEVPQPPPTPEEMPAQPPKVTFNGGQLSIVADNSTLGDVLNAVKKLTGASVDMPGSAAGERVAVALGPGSPEQVLQQLFAGSKFDYIILGSPSNAAAVDKIILSTRGAAASGPTNSVAYQPPSREAYQPPPPPDQNDDDDVSQQPEPPPQQQEEAQPQQTIGPGGEAAAQENNNQPKTPEQLLQELQRMQQQQQQQGRPQRGPTPR